MDAHPDDAAPAQVRRMRYRLEMRLLDRETGREERVLLQTNTLVSEQGPPFDDPFTGETVQDVALRLSAAAVRPL